MYKNLARSFTPVLIGTALSAGMLASANPTQAAPTQAAEPAGDLQKSSLLEFLES
jgi:hypothetical protein